MVYYEDLKRQALQAELQAPLTILQSYEPLTLITPHEETPATP